MQGMKGNTNSSFGREIKEKNQGERIAIGEERSDNFSE